MIEKHLAVAPPNTAREKWTRLLIVIIATILITLLYLPALAQKPLPVDLVVATKAYAYQGPGEDYPILALYSQGITLTVSGRTFDRNWLQVAITDYNTAWMPAEAFVEAPALGDLPLAATPSGLVTVTPQVAPPLTVSMELVQNKSEGFLLPGQRFKVYVQSRQPYTRINIVFYNAAGRQVMKYSGTTDAQGYFTGSYMSGVLTDGTYTVVVTDMSGNKAQATATISTLHEPTPTPKD